MPARRMEGTSKDYIGTPALALMRKPQQRMKDITETIENMSLTNQAAKPQAPVESPRDKIGRLTKAGAYTSGEAAQLNALLDDVQRGILTQDGMIAIANKAGLLRSNQPVPVTPTVPTAGGR